MFVRIKKGRMDVSVLNTKELLCAVSEDHRGAFERFYHLYYDQVFRFSYYCVGDKELCREIVSDVFFSVWQSRKRLKDVTHIETYLYIAVRNEALRFLRMRQDQSFVSLDEVLPDSESDENDSPDSLLESKEMTELLNQAIDELPAQCRLIFLMSRKEGLKTKEIADILHLQESTVRVQMKIAIERLLSRLRKVLLVFFTLF